MTAPPDVEFDVIGDPKPQGSKRAFMAGGRPIVVDDNPASLKSWRREVTLAAAAAWERPPIETPVAVSLAFRMVRPQKPRFAFPGVAPDIDKCARAALDALTAARVFRDDALVVQLNCSQVYESDGHPPGVHVRVWTVR